MQNDNLGKEQNKIGRLELYGYKFQYFRDIGNGGLG